MSQNQNFYGVGNMNMMYGYTGMPGTGMSQIPGTNMSQMPPQEPPKKERVRVKMSMEEKSFFGNLFSLADKQMKGKLEGKEAAQFLKKSGLTTDVLKRIWMISAQTDPNFLEKEEFYVALRLIALAQNNMEVSEEAIKFNSPLPPLPNIDLREKKAPDPNSTTQSTISTNQSTILGGSNEQSPWAISEEDEKKYTDLFSKNKDMDSKISVIKAVEMFKKSRIAQDRLTKILNLVPSMDPKAYTFNEFKVIIHLIYKCYTNVDVPTNLPEPLRFSQPKNNQSLDFMNIIKPIQNISQKQAEVIPISSSFQNPGTNEMNMSSNLLGESNFGGFTNPNPQSSKTSDNNLLGGNTGFSQKIENFISPENKIPQNLNNFSNFSGTVNMSPNNTSMNVVQPSIYTGGQNNSGQTKQLNFDNLKAAQSSLLGTYQEAQNENNFLTKIVEEDQRTLDNITEDLNKTLKNIEMINEKNNALRGKILEIRRKINIERDNLAKANLNLQYKATELINTTNEYEKAQEESNKFFNEQQALRTNQQSNQRNLIEPNQSKNVEFKMSSQQPQFQHPSTISQPQNINNNNFSQIPNTFEKPQTTNIPQNTSLGNNNTFFQPPTSVDPPIPKKQPDGFGFGFDGFPQAPTNEPNKANLNNFNSIDKSNQNTHLSKSPGIHMNASNKQENFGKNFESGNMDFGDKNKNLSSNNLPVKKPDNFQMAPKGDFNFGFSMDNNKPQTNTFNEPPRTAFDKAPQMNTFNEPPKTAFDKPHADQKDFGMYPGFDAGKKNDKDGFDDFGDFGNFESDFHKAKNDKDFFADSNWGEFK